MLSVGNDNKIFLERRAVLQFQDPGFTVDVNDLRGQLNRCRFAWKIGVCRNFFQRVVRINTMVEIPPSAEFLFDIMK